MKKQKFIYQTLINFVDKHVVTRPSTAAEKLSINSATACSYLRYLYHAGLIEKTPDSHNAYTLYRKTKAWSKENAVDAIKNANEELAQKKKRQ